MPSLQTAIELKAVRNETELATALDAILADQANYASAEYQNFIAVIYSRDSKISFEMAQSELDRRHGQLGASLKFRWDLVVSHGALA